jgi:hypothetical protein
MNYLSLPYAYKRGQNVNICAETENNAEQTAICQSKRFSPTKFKCQKQNS